MEKRVSKKRDIRFYSKKNETMVTVHSKNAMKFADLLENDDLVAGYETNVPLENWQQKVSTAGIRSEYVKSEWTSDFMLEKVDGSIAIREVITHDDLSKMSAMQKLEISRRYWKAAHVTDWKIVLAKKEGAAW